jgi:hypothetical protein
MESRNALSLMWLGSVLQITDYGMLSARRTSATETPFFMLAACPSVLLAMAGLPASVRGVHSVDLTQELVKGTSVLKTMSQDAARKLRLVSPVQPWKFSAFGPMEISSTLAALYLAGCIACGKMNAPRLQRALTTSDWTNVESMNPTCSSQINLPSM